MVLPRVAIDSEDGSGIPAALDAVQAADQVILTLGIGYTQEHEGIDRTIINLPGLQDKFAQMVLAIGKPTVIVLINGGIVSIDDLVAPAPAIIEAFYPAMRTGEALYQAIFGFQNRWGKLPVTIYPTDYMSQVDMYSFDMSLAPGRTYRYYTRTPLFPFGWGLSYTTFNYTCTGTTANSETTIDCTLVNLGERSGDEVLQVYHRVGDDIRNQLKQPVPIRALVDFDRYTVDANSKQAVQFVIPTDSLVLTDLNGDKVLYAGTHYLDITNGVSAPATITVVISQADSRIVEQAP